MKKRWYGAVTVLLVVIAFPAWVSAAQKLTATVKELALYKGADRQKILEAGARKEGRLIFYTSGILTQAVRPVVDGFQKKYPYIKVIIWRAGGEQLIPKIMEEYKSGKLPCDVIEGTLTTQLALQAAGISQPYYSPNLPYIDEGARMPAPGGGVFSAGFRESGSGLGYNTKLIPGSDVPRTYRDLLNPKWKGKGALTGSDLAKDVVGAMLFTFGEEYVRRFADQNFAVQMISVRALADMIVNGEYSLSPCITDAHVTTSKQKGAPIEWIPLEPVLVTIGQIALSKQAPNPHAALLFSDFELSRESAEIHRQRGYNPTRTDASGRATYKKFYGVKTFEERMRYIKLFDTLFLHM